MSSVENVTGGAQENVKRAAHLSRDFEDSDDWKNDADQFARHDTIGAEGKRLEANSRWKVKCGRLRIEIRPPARPTVHLPSPLTS
jgi:hypothetical protein